jgi:hypothetical protein
MSFVYVTNSNAPTTTATPYMTISTTSTTSNVVPTSQTLMLDGYSSSTSPTPTSNCTFFKGIINFVLTNPLLNTDDNDNVTVTVNLGAANTAGTTFNTGQCFSIYCYLSNLGSIVYSPVYSIGSGTPNTSGCPSATSFTIPINKWFSFRAPGSTYQFGIMGLNQGVQTITSCTSCVSTGG